MTRGRAAARRLILRQLVVDGRIDSQEGAAELLAIAGHPVTQATVSRDLVAIGAEKDALGATYVLGEAGFTIDENALKRAMETSVVEIAFSHNLVVVHTHPAGAGPVAAAVDGSKLDGVIGTVAGDDTVLVISDESTGGEAVARHLREVMEG